MLWESFFAKLIICPAASYWSPVVFSIVLRSLTKFSWFLLWSWWRWLARHVNMLAHVRHRGHVLVFWFRIYVVSIHFCFKIVLLFLRLLPCWYLKCFSMWCFLVCVFKLPDLVNVIFRVCFYWFYNCWGWFCLFL